MTIRLGILISGRGSNMLAIANAIQSKKLDAKIAIVISNNKNALGLTIAKDLNIPTLAIDPKKFATHQDYESQILLSLLENNVDYVVLAGYMKILGKSLLTAYPYKIVNIHPSLLPSFKGLHPQRQALEYGVKFSGCSVHFVDESLDGGPIILQEVVPVLPDDTEAILSNRILEKEHRLYAKALQLISENRLEIKDRLVKIKPSKIH